MFIYLLYKNRKLVLPGKGHKVCMHENPVKRGKMAVNFFLNWLPAAMLL
jgi:hypothetical protein